MESGPYFHHVRQRSTGWARSVVDECWVIQAERCRAAVELLLPDACVELYFNFGTVGRRIFERDEERGVRGEHSAVVSRHPSPLNPRAAWVVGPHAAPLLVAKETRDCDIVAVRLHAGVAAQLLGVSAHELEGTLMDLDLVWGSMVEEVRERLYEAPDSRSRLRIVEHAITRRLSPAPIASEVARVRSLVRRVGEMSEPSIGRVARNHGLTHRQVIQLFDRHVGIKPKAYHRIHRLRHVLREIHSPRCPPWAQLAAQCGYCDQAHLINDFRKLTGLTPTDYAANRMAVGHGSVPYLLAAG